MIVGCSTDVASPSSKPEPVVLTNPGRPGVDYVGIVGDSFSGGSKKRGTEKTGWPYLVYSQLASQNIYMDAKVDAMDTSGWIKSSRKDARTFAEHLTKSVGTNDRLVVIFGGRSTDAGAPIDELRAAVRGTLAKVRVKAPKATILVIGPVWTAWPHREPDAEVLSVRDIVLDEVEADGALFVDPIAEQWFADRPDLIAPDTVNPTPEGQAYLADRLAPVIGHLLRPMTGS
jgi:hypothetical protein